MPALLIFAIGTFILWNLTKATRTIASVQPEQLTREQKQGIVSQLEREVNTRAQELLTFFKSNEGLALSATGLVLQKERITEFQAAWNRFFTTERRLLGPPPPRGPYKYEVILSTDGKWDANTEVVFQHLTGYTPPNKMSVSGYRFGAIR